MTAQLDIFAAGGVRSFAPHLDPERVIETRVRDDIDRDHVGASEIGRFGNNRAAYVFEVLGAGDVVIYAESFASPEAAEEQQTHHAAMLEVHRQRELF